MADPTTANKLLIAPLRGADVGTWDVPVNSDWTAIDGMLGGSLTISLAGTTAYTLGAPSGSVAAGAGPTQSQNARLTFSGTLSANCAVAIPLPGFYIVNNLCVGSTVILSVPGATGTDQLLGLPPGQQIHVFNDGANISFVNLPPVGTFLDLCVQATPSWITGCTIQPWLVCNGATYTTANFTALGALLGSTFGGNGITTFAVPDLRARYRIPLDNQGGSAAGRITAAISGINGTTWGSSGGDQSLQSHLHAVTDPGHTHTMNAGQGTANQTATGNYLNVVPPLTAANVEIYAASATALFAMAGSSIATAITGVSVQTTGSGGAQNVPPGLVFGMTFIKT